MCFVFSLQIKLMATVAQDICFTRVYGSASTKYWLLQGEYYYHEQIER